MFTYGGGKMFYIVDRIEENIIVLQDENGHMINLNKNSVDENVKEGDCLKKENNKFLFDMEETKKRKMRIDKLMKGMWEN